MLQRHAARACSTATRAASIFTTGPLIHHVQMARLFPDSKTFVDMHALRPSDEVRAAFERLLAEGGHASTRARLGRFVREHFAAGGASRAWIPPDHRSEPRLLGRLRDPRLRRLARRVVALWPALGRIADPSVRLHPDRHSLLYVPNGFIVPGGRFGELYYWDTFWIVRGLLACDMTCTARGVLDNLLYLVRVLGYVPNGGRVYYEGRSQPPLLAAAVESYVAATDDRAWLAASLPLLEQELRFWLEARASEVRVGGETYRLLRYSAVSSRPRPEAYCEDWSAASLLPAERRADYYSDVCAAAESGWDFSSRWRPGGARAFVPVDLNTIFAGALETVGRLRALLGEEREASVWFELARRWRRSVESVLWDEADGAWYDWDAARGMRRRAYYGSCAVPLWAGAAPEGEARRRAKRLLAYLTRVGALAAPGGVPASLFHSGEQWDAPNAWAPLQMALVAGLEAGGLGTAARLLAARWVRACWLGCEAHGALFEKYDAEVAGRPGGGGEYVGQLGFGWTNGVLLEMLARYPDLHLAEADAQLHDFTKS